MKYPFDQNTLPHNFLFALGTRAKFPSQSSSSQSKQSLLGYGSARIAPENARDLDRLQSPKTRSHTSLQFFLGHFWGEHGSAVIGKTNDLIQKPVTLSGAEVENKQPPLMAVAYGRKPG
jgi:hypothetical protein